MNFSLRNVDIARERLSVPGIVLRFIACFFYVLHWALDTFCFPLSLGTNYAFQLKPLNAGVCPFLCVFVQCLSKKVPYGLRLDAVAKREIIINNNHLHTPNLKAGIRRERY